VLFATSTAPPESMRIPLPPTDTPVVLIICVVPEEDTYHAAVPLVLFAQLSRTVVFGELSTSTPLAVSLLPLTFVRLLNVPVSTRMPAPLEPTPVEFAIMLK
jgi:hypothetical protein